MCTSPRPAGWTGDPTPSTCGPATPTRRWRRSCTGGRSDSFAPTCAAASPRCSTSAATPGRSTSRHAPRARPPHRASWPPGRCSRPSTPGSTCPINASSFTWRTRPRCVRRSARIRRGAPRPSRCGTSCRPSRPTPRACRRWWLPLIVHATGLWEAKDALRAGARVLVHSVWSGPVDDEFLALARRAGAIYVPTLTVLDGYGQVTARHFLPDRGALRCVDRATRAKAFATDTVALAQRPPQSLRQRLGRIGRSLAPGLGSTRRHDQGARNLKRVFDAGIPVALGTDAGNPLTLHGASVFRELEAMQASGLPPRDVLVAATRTAARALDLDSIGTITAGAVADLLVLDADPLTDIRHLRDIDRKSTR